MVADKSAQASTASAMRCAMRLLPPPREECSGRSASDISPALTVSRPATLSVLRHDGSLPGFSRGRVTLQAMSRAQRQRFCQVARAACLACVVDVPTSGDSRPTPRQCRVCHRPPCCSEKSTGVLGPRGRQTPDRTPIPRPTPHRYQVDPESTPTPCRPSVEPKSSPDRSRIAPRIAPLIDPQIDSGSTESRPRSDRKLTPDRPRSGPTSSRRQSDPTWTSNRSPGDPESPPARHGIGLGSSPDRPLIVSESTPDGPQLGPERTPDRPGSTPTPTRPRLDLGSTPG